MEHFYSKMGKEKPLQSNGDNNMAMLNEFLFTEIEEENIDNLWFQQGGGTCHTFDVLRSVYEAYIVELMSFGHLGAAI